MDDAFRGPLLEGHRSGGRAGHLFALRAPGLRRAGAGAAGDRSLRARLSRAAPSRCAELHRTYPSSCGEHAFAAIEPTRRLFAAARRAGLPIFYSTHGYARRQPSPISSRRRGASASRPRPSFTPSGPSSGPQPGDVVITKQRATAFYGTPLAAHLTQLGVHNHDHLRREHLGLRPRHRGRCLFARLPRRARRGMLLRPLAAVAQGESVRPPPQIRRRAASRQHRRASRRARAEKGGLRRDGSAARAGPAGDARRRPGTGCCARSTPFVRNRARGTLSILGGLAAVGIVQPRRRRQRALPRRADRRSSAPSSSSPPPASSGTTSRSAASSSSSAMCIASVLGIALGVAMAGSAAVKQMMQPWVSGLYATPTIALAPLFILWFGIGIWSKVIVVVTLVLFPVTINTEAGLRQTSERLIEMLRSFGATRQPDLLEAVAAVGDALRAGGAEARHRPRPHRRGGGRAVRLARRAWGGSSANRPTASTCPTSSPASSCWRSPASS